MPCTARCTIARGRRAESNGASRCPRYRGAVVLSIPPKSHEITVLLPSQCWKSQCFRQEMLSWACDVSSHNLPRDVRRHYRDVWRHEPGNRQNYCPLFFSLCLYGWRHKRGIVDSMDRLVTSYERRFMYVAAAHANYATINPDSQNSFITLYIACWVITYIISYHIILYYIISYHIISYHIISISYHSYHIISHIFVTIF